MKPLRLLALAIAATAWCTSAALACDGSKASAAAASCGAKKTASAKAASAAHASCASKSATTTAVAAASKDGHCPASASCPMGSEQCKAMMAAGACTPEMMAACAAKGTRSASADKCTMHAMAAHADCAVCADEMACDDEVRATGARSQVVALRNGTMIVYTTDDDASVRGLQSAVALHNDRVVAALQGSTKLCTACKKLRGALASGKLVREVVNLERGCQVIITSSDRSIVQQVHACTNAQMAARTKI